jgi:hypothetical protein
VTNRYSDEVVRQGEAYEDSQDMGALAVLSQLAEATRQLRGLAQREGWIHVAIQAADVALAEADALLSRSGVASRSGVTLCAGCGWRAGHDSRCPLAGDGLSRSVVRQGHTPGPWTVEERGSGLTSALAEALEPAWTHLVTMPAPPFAFGKTGAAVSAGYSSGGKVSLKDRAEAAATARLIAKAPAIPSLLSALRPIAAAYPDDPGTSDLDDEQPVTITLGDVRRARAAIREVEGGGR